MSNSGFENFCNLLRDTVEADVGEDAQNVQDELRRRWSQLSKKKREQYAKNTDNGSSTSSDDEDNLANQPKTSKRESSSSKAKRLRQLDNQLTQLKQKQKELQRKRVEHLLGQSELFRRFIQSSGRVPASSTTQSKTTNDAAPSRRTHRQLNGNESAVDETEEFENTAGDSLETDETSNITRLDKQPSIVNGQMRDYQLEGLNWMIQLQQNGLNGILADEMGLGKTLQTISLLGYNLEYRGFRGPHLILVPKSTLSNWINEIKRWCPSLRALCFHGDKDERKKIIQDCLRPGTSDTKRTWDVLVTTYEMAIIEKGTIGRWAWEYLVIDEAHRIKNENSTLAQTVRNFAVAHRLLLTGTPLQNNLHELWALLYFLLPDVFGDSDVFDEWFDIANGDENAKSSMIQQLHRLLRPFMLRRLKSDVATSLPPKKETFVYVGLTPMQRTVYRNILKRDVGAIVQTKSSEGNDTAQGASHARLLNVVMQLRKVCDHPYLFPGVEDRSLDPLGDHVITASAKLQLLDKLLIRLKKRGSRVLIFSQMTRLLDILEDYCAIRSYSYCRIDGQTDYVDREQAIDDFNAPNSSKFIFLLSTRAGGLGINLATADTVILYDSDWNPQVDLQAQDRAHRIGQQKPVTVYRLITSDTVEEKILERAMIKLKLDAVVVQQGRLAAKQNRLSTAEMLSMVRYGADSVFRRDETDTSINDSQEMFTDEDIDAILSRSQEMTNKMQMKYDQLGKAKAAENGGESASLLEFKIDTSHSGSQVFEGVDYSKEAARRDADTARLEQLVYDVENESLQKRRDRRVVATYNEDVLLGKKQRTKRSTEQQWATIASARRKVAQVLPRYRCLPRLGPWQFLDATRLIELARAEVEYTQKQSANAKENEAQSNSQVETLLSFPEEFPALEKERQALIAEGFPTWTRRDFRLFIEACCTDGRFSGPQIAEEIASQTKHPFSECMRYYNMFWFGVNQDSDLPISEKFQLIKQCDTSSTSPESWKIGMGRTLPTWPRVFEKIQRAENRMRDVHRLQDVNLWGISMTCPAMPSTSLIEANLIPQELYKASSHTTKEILAVKRFSPCSKNAQTKTMNSSPDPVLKPTSSPENDPKHTYDEPERTQNAIQYVRSPDPWTELKWKYEGRKSKVFSAEHDRFLLCAVAKVGHGHWRSIKKQIMHSPRWRFDLFFRSRTPQDLARRTETLMRCVERNVGDTWRKLAVDESNRHKALNEARNMYKQEETWSHKQQELIAYAKRQAATTPSNTHQQEKKIDIKRSNVDMKDRQSQQKAHHHTKHQKLRAELHENIEVYVDLVQKLPSEKFKLQHLPRLVRIIQKKVKKSKYLEIKQIAEAFVHDTLQRQKSAMKARQGEHTSTSSAAATESIDIEKELTSTDTMSTVSDAIKVIQMLTYDRIIEEASTHKTRTDEQEHGDVIKGASNDPIETNNQKNQELVMAETNTNYTNKVETNGKNGKQFESIEADAGKQENDDKEMAKNDDKEMAKNDDKEMAKNDDKEMAKNDNKEMTEKDDKHMTEKDKHMTEKDTQMTEKDTQMTEKHCLEFKPGIEALSTATRTDMSHIAKGLESAKLYFATLDPLTGKALQNSKQNHNIPNRNKHENDQILTVPQIAQIKSILTENPAISKPNLIENALEQFQANGYPWTSSKKSFLLQLGSVLVRTGSKWQLQDQALERIKEANNAKLHSNVSSSETESSTLMENSNVATTSPTTETKRSGDTDLDINIPLKKQKLPINATAQRTLNDMWT